MSAQDMTTAELLVVGRGLQGKSEILSLYPLTAAYPAAIDEGVTELIAAEDGLNPGPPSRSALLRAADQGVDRPLALFSRAIDWLQDAFPAEQDLWDRVYKQVLPKGLRSTARTAKWTEAHMKAVFDPIDLAVAEATKRADAEGRRSGAG